MTQPALASFAALEERLGRALTGDEATRAQAALDDVSALVRDAAGQAWITEGALDADVPDIVVSTVLAAAVRAFEIPAGTTAVTIGNVSMRFERSGAYLTDEELAAIHSASDEASSGMNSVEVTVPWDLRGGADTYIDVVGQAEPMPFTEP